MCRFRILYSFKFVVGIIRVDWTMGNDIKEPTVLEELSFEENLTS